MHNSVIYQYFSTWICSYFRKTFKSVKWTNEDLAVLGNEVEMRAVMADQADEEEEEKDAMRKR